MSLFNTLVGIGVAILIGWLIYLTLLFLRLRAKVSDQSQENRSRGKRHESETRNRDDIIVAQLERLDHDHRMFRQELAEIYDRQTSSPTKEPETHSLSATFQSSKSFTRNDEVRTERAVFDEIEREVLLEYNALAAEFSGPRRDKFLGQFNPISVAFDHGKFVQQENGQYWLIEPIRAEHAIVIPIGKVARDWEKLYRSMGGLTAKQTFGEVFDLEEGSNLKVAKPAKAELLRSGGRLTDMGQLEGL